MVRDWTGYCLVGYGRHSQAQLVPAIENSGMRLEAIVTSQSGKGLASNYKLFANLADALKRVPDRTCFLLATPPGAHYLQAKTILSRGFDVLIEKPGFVDATELLDTLEILRHNQVLGVTYMHKHTELFQNFKNVWSAKLSSVNKVNIKFLLPNLPSNTFRDDSAIENSIIFDVGCYIADTLVEMNFDFASIKIEKVSKHDDRVNYVLLSGASPVSLIAEFGFGFSYSNCVSLTFKDGTLKDFAPFYWGRSGVRTVTVKGGSDLSVLQRFNESNSFEIMLAKKRQFWINSREEEIRKLVLTTKLLQEWAENAY